MKHFKHTNEYVDLKIKSRNIKRLENIVNATTKIKWKCQVCKFIWRQDSHHIINHLTGCPFCAKNLPTTNEQIDNRLKNRNIIRIDDVINAKTNIRWKCLICLNIWKTNPNHISNGRGCPKCAGNEKLTNEIVDERIKYRSIKRLENVKRAIDKIEWQCNICNNKWKANPHNILNYRGCPNCVSGVNERLIREFLMEKDIKFENLTLHLDCGRCFPDFYLQEFKTIIEYNGEQHYKPVRFGNQTDQQIIEKFKKQQKRDEQLRKYCEINKINLIEINGIIFQNKKLRNLLEKLLLNKFIYPF